MRITPTIQNRNFLEDLALSKATNGQSPGADVERTACEFPFR